MLYVSRVIDRARIGVIDTSDETETIVSETELRRVVCELGLPVRGVVCDAGGNFVCARAVAAPVDTKVLSAKLAALCGVSIIVRNDVIECVEFSDTAPRTAVRIRLSNFADSCSNASTGIFKCSSSKSSYVGVGENIVFVLDDRLKVTGHTFTGLACFDCKVDLSEVTDINVLKAVYSKVGVDTMAEPGEYFEDIIDSKKRQSLFCAEVGLSSDVSHSSRWETLFKELSKSSYVRDGLWKMHMQEFNDLLTAELRKPSGVDFSRETLCTMCAIYMEQGENVHALAHSPYVSVILLDYFCLGEKANVFDRLVSMVDYCQPPNILYREYMKFVKRLYSVVHNDYLNMTRDGWRICST